MSFKPYKGWCSNKLYHTYKRDTVCFKPYKGWCSNRLPRGLFGSKRCFKPYKGWCSNFRVTMSTSEKFYVSNPIRDGVQIKS